MTIKENLKYCKEFGLWITFSKTVNKLLSPTKFKARISEWNNRQIKNYLKKTCKNTMKKYKKKDFELTDMYNQNNIAAIPDYDSGVIWTMWWQGESQAPDIVRMCIENMRKYSKGHRVIVITENNYKEFVTIPNYIMDGVVSGTISFTKLSDIIRINLLYNWGGCWMDSTVLVTDDIDEEIFDYDFYSLYINDLSGRNITIYFMAAKRNSMLIQFVRDMTFEYFQTHSNAIHYFLVDYFFMIAEEDFKEFGKIIRHTCNTNKAVDILQKEIDKGPIPLNVDVWNTYKKDTKYFKLNYKFPNQDRYTDNGSPTMLGYLFELYGKM